MKPDPGTYVLILRCDSNARVQVGRWREIKLEPGYYLYIGSAFGPGGVRARLSRHFREDKSKHWHIDYLREHVNPIAAWFSYELKRLEHLWAQALNDSREFSPIKGFGCSDCKCFSHLFHTSKAPDLDGFTNIIGKTLQAWKT